MLLLQLLLQLLLVLTATRCSQITNFQNYFVPFPNWYVLGPNIQYFHEHGVKGIFEEGTYGTKGGDLTELKDYIIARSLWNISTDTDDHIKDFVAGYYGPKAGPFVQLYMDVMHGAIAETNYYMRESFDWHAAFLTKMTMLECGKAFKNAQAVATGRYVKRVENAMMPSMFVTLLRWTEFENFAKNESLPWPWKPTKQAQFDYFSELYGAAGVTKLSEGGRDITWLHSELFPTPKPPGPKPPPPPPVQWNSLQLLLSNPEAILAADPGANILRSRRRARRPTAALAASARSARSRTAARRASAAPTTG